MADSMPKSLNGASEGWELASCHWKFAVPSFTGESQKDIFFCSKMLWTLGTNSQTSFVFELKVALDPDISAADLLQQQDMIIEVAFFGKKNCRPQEFSDSFCCSQFWRLESRRWIWRCGWEGSFAARGSRWDFVYFSSLCFCEASGLGKFPPPLMVAGNVEFWSSALRKKLPCCSSVSSSYGLLESHQRSGLVLWNLFHITWHIDIHLQKNNFPYEFLKFKQSLNHSSVMTEANALDVDCQLLKLWT